MDGPMGKWGKTLEETLVVRADDPDYQKVTKHQMSRAEQLEILNTLYPALD